MNCVELEENKVKDRKEKFEKFWVVFCENYGNGYDKSLAKHFFVLGYGDSHLKLLELQGKIEDLEESLTDLENGCE